MVSNQKRKSLAPSGANRVHYRSKAVKLLIVRKLEVEIQWKDALSISHTRLPLQLL